MKSLLQIKNNKLAVFKTMPAQFNPQLATLTQTFPSDDDWLYEKKYDGYRILAFIQDKQVKLLSRNGLDWSAKFPELQLELSKLPVKSAVLDGELVALDNRGISRFQLLQNAINLHHERSLQYLVFDLPFYNNYDLTALPLIERRTLLKLLLENFRSEVVEFSAELQGNPQKLFQTACAAGEEGLIAKRKDSHYINKRSHDWIKLKCRQSDEFVIAGYTDPEGTRDYFGSLLIGYFDKNQQLQYAGRVGTGFTQLTLQELYQKMKPLAQELSAFHDTKNIPGLKSTHWIKPQLVAQVQYNSWTDEHLLRHPSFQGLREDKSTMEIIMEEPTEDYNLAGITITHPQKIYFPEEQITKLELAEYYYKYMDWILPHVINRPISILRCPDGIAKECFYQKHIESLPKSLGTVEVEEEGSKQLYVVIKNAENLLSLFQYGTIELHAWGCLADDVEKPDRIIFDLDPGPEVAFTQIIDCAQILHAGLEELGLQSFVKTSGKKGLHICVPIARTYSWEAVKSFSGALAEHLVKLEPKLFITNISKTKRTGKILIDYYRNVRGATCVAAYSTRATVHANISMPLTWDELAKLESNDQFNLHNVNRRLGHLNSDPWEPCFTLKQKLPDFM